MCKVLVHSAVPLLLIPAKTIDYLETACLHIHNCSLLQLSDGTPQVSVSLVISNWFECTSYPEKQLLSNRNYMFFIVFAPSVMSSVPFTSSFAGTI
jgi:hypothetical protein